MMEPRMNGSLICKIQMTLKNLFKNEKLEKKKVIGSILGKVITTKLNCRRFFFF